MTKSGQPAVPRLLAMALYVAGAWAMLALLMYAGSWEPTETALQSGRVIVLISASVALIMCVLGATSKLLAATGATVPDAEPKP